MFEIGSMQWPGVSKLTEECGEVLQVTGKLMGTQGKVEHWDGEGNLDRRLEAELGDLLAAIEFICQHCPINRETVIARAHQKFELFNEWHRRQTQPPGAAQALHIMDPYDTGNPVSVGDVWVGESLHVGNLPAYKPKRALVGEAPPEQIVAGSCEHCPPGYFGVLHHVACERSRQP